VWTINASQPERLVDNEWEADRRRAMARCQVCLNVVGYLRRVSLDRTWDPLEWFITLLPGFVTSDPGLGSVGFNRVDIFSVDVSASLN
jgi:hypothetical protein